jgi:hypothetical protein
MNRQPISRITVSLVLLVVSLTFVACESQGLRVDGRIVTHPQPGNYNSTIWIDTPPPLAVGAVDLNGAHITLSYMGVNGRERSENAMSDPDGTFELDLPLDRAPFEKEFTVTLKAEMDGYQPAKTQFKYGSASVARTAFIFLRKK